MKTIGVLGLGKVGSLVAHLLSKEFKVIAVDKQKPLYPFSSAVQYRNIDVQDEKEFSTLLNNVDGVVSCLTYNLNKQVAKACIQHGKHYFDLTEDIETTNFIRNLAKNAETVAIPQCGLAPGFIGIVGYDLTTRFKKLRDVELRVGALPRYPNGLLAYSFTWSPAGVINEYLNDAEVIHNGTRKMVPSLTGVEHIQIEGKEFEAFATSGGLGTLCETLEGKLDTLNYKSIRYPGHAKLMTFLLYELILKNDRQRIEDILTNAKPPVKEDVVYVYAVVEGEKDNGTLEREEFFSAYKPKLIDGILWRAISWTTAASVVAVVSLVAQGKIPTKGFVKQEDISLELFYTTPTGIFFKP